MSRSRILALEGIHNFRDYGDYAAGDGGRVKAGVLWRSGQHAGGSPADLAAVARLGLCTVIDLRGDSEREAFPCLRAPDFEPAVLFAPGETAALRSMAAHAEAGKGVRTAADVNEAMDRLYRDLAWRPVLVGTLRLYFEALAEREGPSLLHCLAGKDRTGLAAALAHHVLGVHPDDMMADYLLTNEAGDIDRRVADARSTMRNGISPDLDDSALRTLLSVRPEYLTTAFDEIKERHGSVNAYLVDVVHVTPERRAAIRARWLE